MAWLIDHIYDVDADFRTYYRIPQDPTEPGIADGEFGGLSSSRFFRLAERLSAYQGVVAARIAEEQHREKHQGPAPTPARSSQPAAQERRVVNLHQLMLIDPSLIQYEKV